MDFSMMQQWLPWIMAAGNMLQAGSRSTDPRSGDLGYVWGSGLTGFAGAQNQMMDQGDRQRYYELMRRRYDLMDREIAEKEAEGKRRREEAEGKAPPRPPTLADRLPAPPAAWMYPEDPNTPWWQRPSLY